jgi:hypothetical protein
MMDDGLRARFGAHLETGEDILWVGRPLQGLVVRNSDAFLIPLSAIWCAGVANWAWEVFTLGAPLDFKIIGVVGTLIGIYILFGRFLVDAHFRGRSYYAVTTRRALVIGGVSGRNIASFGYPDKKDLSLALASDDRATVRFGAAWPFITLHATYWRNPEFFRVQDAFTAAELLRNPPNVR